MTEQRLSAITTRCLQLGGKHRKEKKSTRTDDNESVDEPRSRCIVNDK